MIWANHAAEPAAGSLLFPGAQQCSCDELAEHGSMHWLQGSSCCIPVRRCLKVLLLPPRASGDRVKPIAFDLEVSARDLAIWCSPFGGGSRHVGGLSHSTAV